MKIDTHQHFWKYNENDYPWMGDNETLKHDRLPDDLKPLMDATGIDGTVAVQARQIVEESDFLLDLADRYDFIKGVVGWVDLRSPQLDKQLERLAKHPKFVGVRHVVHDEPDDEFMLREDFQRGISRLKDYNLAYDLLLFAKHVPIATQLVEKFPEQPFVVDHIAKPLIKDGVLEPWSRDIRELAYHPNVMCKISGMVTEADHQNWKPDDLQPYMDVVAEAFGADRLMIGSDWPVCTLAGSYETVMQIAFDYVARHFADQRAAIWSDNAASFYNLNL